MIHNFSATVWRPHARNRFGRCRIQVVIVLLSAAWQRNAPTTDFIVQWLMLDCYRYMFKYAHAYTYDSSFVFIVAWLVLSVLAKRRRLAVLARGFRKERLQHLADRHA